jgi:hypothetical protein
MSQKLRSHLVFFLLVFALVILVFPVYAQPGGGGNPCPFPPCNPDVPISGIEVLLVAGGVLGVKRILGLIRKPKNQ